MTSAPHALDFTPAPKDDRLVHVEPDLHAGQQSLTPFDRFYFNAQSPDGGLVLILGVGHYAGARIEDGYCCAGLLGSQVNTRFAQHAAIGAFSERIGPLQFSVEEPLRRWTLAIDDERSPIRLRLTARARALACKIDPIVVEHPGEPKTSFQHFFQAMTYDGEISVDGVTHRVDGWFGQRDRSWGVRRTRERLGLHLWAGIHGSRSHIGFNYNEARDHSVSHCDGAVRQLDGRGDRIADVMHDLELNDDRTLIKAGMLTVITDSGRRVQMEVRPFGAKYELAGAGYDGRHGTPVAGREFETERWDFSDDAWASSLTMRVAGQIATFSIDGEAAPGIMELGVTRNSSYQYASKQRPAVES